MRLIIALQVLQVLLSGAGNRTKAIGSKFGALAEEEYDKIAPVIACTLPALTDSIPERKRKELAGEVTRELQVVGNAASIAIRTWVRSNDKSKARAEEREKNIGWIGRMFTAWRVSHAERREEREAAGEDDNEEDDTPVVIPSSAVTTYPKGTPVPTPSIKVQVIEERADLSNNIRERFLAIPNNSNTHSSFGAWSPVHARARRADRVAR